MVARDCGGGGRDKLMGTGFPFKVMKVFWNEIDMVKALTATELYPVKWFVSCYVNFTSI